MDTALLTQSGTVFDLDQLLRRHSTQADAAAEAITVQYGGSMNDANAAELLAKENVDGGLIGGASLKTDKFTAIVKAANA